MPKHKFPLLRCPVCGYEYRPTRHGWAFMFNSNTKCEGIEVKSAFAHPFEKVEENN